MKKFFYLLVLLAFIGININAFSQLNNNIRKDGKKIVIGDENQIICASNTDSIPDMLKRNLDSYNIISNDSIRHIFSSNDFDESMDNNDSYYNLLDSTSISNTRNISFGKVSDIELSPVGNLAASATGIGIVIWNTLTSDTVKVIRTHLNCIGCITWSPDGKRIASGSYNNSLPYNNLMQLWDVQSGKLIKIGYESTYANRFSEIVWSPDGSKIVAGINNEILIFDADSLNLINNFNIDCDYVQSIEYSPDSKLISIVSRISGYSHPKGDILTTWSVDSVKKVHKHNMYKCYDISYFPDGSKFFASGGSKTFVFDTKTGKKLDSLFPTSSLTISPNGKYIAALRVINGNSKLFVYNYSNFEELFSVNTYSFKPKWSSDSENLLYYNYEAINYSSIIKNSIISTIPIKSSIHNMIYWSQDGKSVSPNGLDFYDYKNGETLEEFDAIVGAISPDGNKILYIQHNDNMDYIIYDRITGQSSTIYTHYIGNMQYCLLWNSDGTRFYTVNTNKKVLIWDASDYSIIDSIDGDWMQSLEKILISPDGKYLTGIDDLGKAYIWDLESRIKLSEFKAHAFAWHPSEPYYIKSAWINSAQIINIETGEVIKNITDVPSDASAIDWSPNGNFIAIASHDGTIRVLEAFTYTVLDSCKINNARLVDIKFSPDSEELLTGDELSVLNIWKFNAGIYASVDDFNNNNKNSDNDNISINITNQVNGQVMFDYQISKDSEIEIIVYDIFGNEIDTILEEQIQKSGIFHRTINTSNYSSASYFIVLRTSNSVKTAKFIVQK